MSTVIVVDKALFIPTGTYSEHYVRPYTTTLTDHNLVNHMQQQTNCGENLEATNLAGIAGTILTPAAQVGANNVANIVNGWNQRRYRFMIMLSVQSLGIASTHVLTGYTDYMGTANGKVDPNMRLTINNSMILHTSQIMGQRGTVNRTIVTENSQMIANPATPGEVPQYGPYAEGDTGGVVLLRPEDVFNRISTLALDGVENGMVHDMRTTVPKSSVKKSNRNNGDASMYLSKTLKAYKTATADSDLSNDPMNAANVAAGMVKSGDLFNDPVFYALSTHTDYQTSGSISYQTADSVFGGLDQKATFMGMPEVQRVRRPHEVGDSEVWHGATAETVAANILATAIPTIMSDTLLTRVRFHAHNNTMDGSINFTLAEDNPVSSFANGVDIRPYLEVFRSRLVNVVLRDISHHNQIRFAVTCDVDILGETDIHISLNGYPAERFNKAAFADALCPPVISASMTDLHNLSADIDNLAANVLYDGGMGY